MPVFTAVQLRQVGQSLFTAAGALKHEAETVAELLVEANLVGHDSHGVIRISQYLDSIGKGDIVPGAPVDILEERAASAVVDGHWGFGQVIAGRAVEVARAKAAQSGVAALTVRNANHIGRLGSYVEALARDGMIGLLFANMHGRGGGVVPWGGREPCMGTNPLAMAFPTGKGAPVVLDMTTSVVAEGKVRLWRNRGEAVPEGWLVDAEGNPTNDPQTLYGDPHGGILPFGGDSGYKGFGLNLATDLLAGALSGAGCTGKEDARFGNAAFMLVIALDHFVEKQEYDREVGDFIDFVKASPTAAGVETIYLPGEIEAAQEKRRRAEGIFVEDETWGQIVVWAEKLGADIKVNN
jgi:hydroxycarboxylate dehydrogenase B